MQSVSVPEHLLIIHESDSGDLFFALDHSVGKHHVLNFTGI